MKYTLFTILILLNLCARTQICIINVNLIDVDNKKIIPNTAVVISGNKITTVGNAKTKLPDNATIIDGSGKYLLPGLTDAHIHFFQSGGLYTRPDAIDLRQYKPYASEIAESKKNMPDVLKWNMINGITTVIDVGASYNLLTERKKYVDSAFAPKVYMTGPLLTTYEPDAFKNLENDRPFSIIESVDDARKMVQEQLTYHPDFIKVWYIVLDKDKETGARKHLPVIKAIIEEAHKHQLKVAVHATERITAQLAVENGADFLVHGIEDEVIKADFIQLLKNKKTVVCPTLVVSGNYFKVFAQENKFSVSEFTKSDPWTTGTLFDLKHLADTNIQLLREQAKLYKPVVAMRDSVRNLNLKQLNDAGVRIVAGTDAGNIGTLHGGSYVRELLAMQYAGMSNWQVLQSATINPAYIFNNEKTAGSIQPGKIADMILLNANPVDDLNNLVKIDKIFNKGNMLYPDSIIKETPVALVQRQLNAYNARDIEAFMEPYADDIELYDYKTGKLLDKGKEAMKKGYAWFDQVPELHCEIKARIVQGNIVIDKERVTGFGDRVIEATAIYHIENNKIKKVYFIE